MIRVKEFGVNTYKIDSVANISQTASIQKRAAHHTSQSAPIKTEPAIQHDSELSKLLSIVKSEHNTEASDQKVQALKAQLTNQLYKPDIEQLIEQVTNSLIGKGLIS